MKIAVLVHNIPISYTDYHQLCDRQNYKNTKQIENFESNTTEYFTFNEVHYFPDLEQALWFMNSNTHRKELMKLVRFEEIPVFIEQELITEKTITVQNDKIIGEKEHKTIRQFFKLFEKNNFKE
jgi:hypothetical protein